MKNFGALLITLFIIPFSLTAVAEAPLTVEGAKTINAAEAKGLFDSGALFIDPRRDSDYAAGRIPDAVHLNSKSVLSEDTLAAEAKKDEAIVFYCNGPKCKRSAVSSEKAVSWGYTQIYYFRDGFPAWKEAGYPVE
ncbi:rhodanese-like domain-containing protein [Oceaniserpentilla sp. 4NH20-0058]|uniref:rhodanese-like domain-containing protein n=1 Tax=Oceaniserpentilla sp. 4NH20-0058 TaxID=3127660 RepID=UPI00310530CF